MRTICLLLALLQLVTPCYGATTLGATTNDRFTRVQNSTINDFTAFTMMAWVRPTSFPSGGRRIFHKGDTVSNLKTINWNVNGGANVEVFRATTQAQTTTANSTFTTNTWQCIAVTYDETNGALIYRGTLTTALTQASYTGGGPSIGAGATNTDSAGNLSWGNLPSGGAAFAGQLGFGIYINGVKTLGEMQTWQFHPQNMTNTAVFVAFGLNGTGNQPDLSGNGNQVIAAGTITLFDHVPLRSWFAKTYERLWEQAFAHLGVRNLTERYMYGYAG
jgi:hypothetical protein